MRDARDGLGKRSMLFLESVQSGMKTGMSAGIRGRNLVLLRSVGSGCKQEVKKGLVAVSGPVRFLNNPNTSLPCFSLFFDPVPDFFLESSNGRALIASSKSWMVLRDVSFVFRTSDDDIRN